MPQNITTEDAGYAYDIVKKICIEVGPGLPGSSQERERATIVQKELQSHLGIENVEVEEFSFAPGAFLSTYPICGILMLIAALLNIFTGYVTGSLQLLTSAAALTFSLAVSFLFVFGFVMAYELFDPLFSKMKSVNVIGKLHHPEGKTIDQLLIISGHHDSAPENTWLRFLGYGFFILLTAFLVGYITLLVMSTVQLLGVITHNANLVNSGTLGWVTITCLIAPAVIFAVFFTRMGKGGGHVPGAADNLSACALLLSLCRFLVKNPSYIPAGTEIRFISFGAEEAGYRGSRRYVKRHLEELKRLDTRMLNIETVSSLEFTILTSDINGTVKNSPEMVESLVKAAELAGVQYKTKPATLGTANDSGPFSREGLRAAIILGFKIPQQFVAFYHQRWDRPEILTIEPLLNMLRLTFVWIKNESGK